MRVEQEVVVRIVGEEKAIWSWSIFVSQDVKHFFGIMHMVRNRSVDSEKVGRGKGSRLTFNLQKIIRMCPV